MLVVPAALAAVAIAVPVGIGSSHREAPDISLDPTADNTDTDAFTPKNAPGALTFVADWIPGEVPANGPNFFGFDDQARYTSTSTIPATAGPTSATGYPVQEEGPEQGTVPLRAPGREWLRLLEAQRDPAITRWLARRPLEEGRSRRTGAPLPAAAGAPPNIGPKTFPNYQAFGNGAIKNLGEGTKVFGGQRYDPFFV